MYSNIYGVASCGCVLFRIYYDMIMRARNLKHVRKALAQSIDL